MVLQFTDVRDLDDNIFTRRDVAKLRAEDVGCFWRLLKKACCLTLGDSIIEDLLCLKLFLDQAMKDFLANAASETHDTDAVVERESVNTFLDGILLRWISERLLKHCSGGC